MIPLELLFFLLFHPGEMRPLKLISNGVGPVEHNMSSVLKRVCRLNCSQSVAAQQQEGCGFETESGTFPCRVCVGFSPGALTHTRLTVWLVVCLPACVCCPCDELPEEEDAESQKWFLCFVAGFTP